MHTIFGIFLDEYFRVLFADAESKTMTPYDGKLKSGTAAAVNVISEKTFFSAFDFGRFGAVWNVFGFGSTLNVLERFGAFWRRFYFSFWTY